MSNVTLDMVMNYPINIFLEGAQHFGATGGTWQNTSSAQHSEAMALNWDGVAGMAYRAVAAHDHATVTAASDQALEAAATAAADGETAGPLVTKAWGAISDAQSDGFKVGQDFSLTDLMPPSTSSQARQQRQQEANDHAQTIGNAVTALVVQDTRAASNMKSAGNFSKFHTSPNGHLPDGKVQIYGPDGHQYGGEQVPDGNGGQTLHTFQPAIPAQEGEWPDWPTGYTPTGGGSGAQLVDYTTNSDGTVKNPTSEHPSHIINQQPPPNPKDHECSTRELLDGTAQVLAGGAGMAGGSMGSLPFLPALGAVIGGSKLVYDGLDDLSHCTNANG